MSWLALTLSPQSCLLVGSLCSASMGTIIGAFLFKPLSASPWPFNSSFLLPNLSLFLTSWSGVSCCSPGPQLTSYFLQHLFLFGSLRAWRRSTISAPVPPVSAPFLTFVFSTSEWSRGVGGLATIAVIVNSTAGPTSLCSTYNSSAPFEIFRI